MSTPMTVYGKNLIDTELDALVKNDREEIKIAIAEARAHGDLKENAEYHAAKEKQGHIEGRIAELQGMLASAQVVDPTQATTEKIVFGATVTVLHVENDESVTFQIVGENEAMTSNEKISYSSPLGKSLIGKEEGDEVIVKAPKGNIEYEVESVEYK